MLLALPGDKMIVIYRLCEEGADSAQMALELIRLGYGNDQIKVLANGLILWDERGYPDGQTGNAPVNSESTDKISQKQGR
jgi:rhodanese-related sulfurtransferase